MDFTSEQIQILLIEKIAGTIAPKDDLVIEQLLADDAGVRRLWLEMNQQVRQAEAQGFSLNVNEEHRWQQLRLFLKKQRRPSRVSFARVVGVAAAIAAVVVGMYFFMKEQPSLQADVKQPGITLSMDNGEIIRLHDHESKTLQFGGATFQVSDKELTYASSPAGPQPWSTLAVPASFDYKVRLSDGTEVWLNAETSLRFPVRFFGQTREVYIDGEAYFKVAKNTRQPFIVHTPKTDVLVTGTQFNVNTYNGDGIQTALVEGAVVTKSAGSRQVDLKPGFKVTYNAQRGFRTEAFDETEVLSWMKGVYYFHNASLQELANVLARWYAIKVHFEDAALQQKTFSGELKKQQSLQSFLDNLRLSADVQSSTKDGVVYFK